MGAPTWAVGSRLQSIWRRESARVGVGKPDNCRSDNGDKVQTSTTSLLSLCRIDRRGGQAPPSDDRSAPTPPVLSATWRGTGGAEPSHAHAYLSVGDEQVAHALRLGARGWRNFRGADEPESRDPRGLRVPVGRQGGSMNIAITFRHIEPSEPVK